MSSFEERANTIRQQLLQLSEIIDTVDSKLANVGTGSNIFRSLITDVQNLKREISSINADIFSFRLSRELEKERKLITSSVNAIKKSLQSIGDVRVPERFDITVSVIGLARLEKLESVLTRIAGKEYGVRVNVDLSSFDSSLLHIRQRLEDIEKRSYSVNVGIDVNNLETSFNRARKFLEDIQGKQYQANIGIDLNAFEASLLQVRRSLEEIQKPLVANIVARVTTEVQPQTQSKRTTKKASPPSATSVDPVAKESKKVVEEEIRTVEIEQKPKRTRRRKSTDTDPDIKAFNLTGDIRALDFSGFSTNLGSSLRKLSTLNAKFQVGFSQIGSIVNGLMQFSNGLSILARGGSVLTSFLDIFGGIIRGMRSLQVIESYYGMDFLPRPLKGVFNQRRSETVADIIEGIFIAANQVVPEVSTRSLIGSVTKRQQGRPSAGKVIRSGGRPPVEPKTPAEKDEYMWDPDRQSVAEGKKKHGKKYDYRIVRRPIKKGKLYEDEEAEEDLVSEREQKERIRAEQKERRRRKARKTYEKDVDIDILVESVVDKISDKVSERLTKFENDLTTSILTVIKVATESAIAESKKPKRTTKTNVKEKLDQAVDTAATIAEEAVKSAIEETTSEAKPKRTRRTTKKTTEPKEPSVDDITPEQPTDTHTQEGKRRRRRKKDIQELYLGFFDKTNIKALDFAVSELDELGNYKFVYSQERARENVQRRIESIGGIVQDYTDIQRLTQRILDDLKNTLNVPSYKFGLDSLTVSSRRTHKLENLLKSDILLSRVDLFDNLQHTILGSYTKSGFTGRSLVNLTKGRQKETQKDFERFIVTLFHEMTHALDYSYNTPLYRDKQIKSEDFEFDRTKVKEFSNKTARFIIDTIYKDLQTDILFKQGELSEAKTKVLAKINGVDYKGSVDLDYWDYFLTPKEVIANVVSSHASGFFVDEFKEIFGSEEYRFLAKLTEPFSKVFNKKTPALSRLTEELFYIMHNIESLVGPNEYPFEESFRTIQDDLYNYAKSLRNFLNKNRKKLLQRQYNEIDTKNLESIFSEITENLEKQKENIRASFGTFDELTPEKQRRFAHRFLTNLETTKEVFTAAIYETDEIDDYLSDPAIKETKAYSGFKVKEKFSEYVNLFLSEFLNNYKGIVENKIRQQEEELHRSLESDLKKATEQSSDLKALLLNVEKLETETKPKKTSLSERVKAALQRSLEIQGTPDVVGKETEVQQSISLAEKARSSLLQKVRSSKPITTYEQVFDLVRDVMRSGLEQDEILGKALSHVFIYSDYTDLNEAFSRLSGKKGTYFKEDKNRTIEKLKGFYHRSLDKQDILGINAASFAEDKFDSELFSYITLHELTHALSLKDQFVRYSAQKEFEGKPDLYKFITPLLENLRVKRRGTISNREVGKYLKSVSKGTVDKSFFTPKFVDYLFNPEEIVSNVVASEVTGLFRAENIEFYGKDLYESVARDVGNLIEFLNKRKDVVLENLEKVRLIAQEYMKRDKDGQFRLFEDIVKETESRSQDIERSLESVKKLSFLQHTGDTPDKSAEDLASSVSDASEKVIEDIANEVISQAEQNTKEAVQKASQNIKQSAKSQKGKRRRGSQKDKADIENVVASAAEEATKIVEKAAQETANVLDETSSDVINRIVENVVKSQQDTSKNIADTADKVLKDITNTSAETADQIASAVAKVADSVISETDTEVARSGVEEAISLSERARRSLLQTLRSFRPVTTYEDVYELVSNVVKSGLEQDKYLSEAFENLFIYSNVDDLNKAISLAIGRPGKYFDKSAEKRLKNVQGFYYNLQGKDLTSINASAFMAGNFDPDLFFYTLLHESTHVLSKKKEFAKYFEIETPKGIKTQFTVADLERIRNKRQKAVNVNAIKNYIQSISGNAIDLSSITPEYIQYLFTPSEIVSNVIAAEGSGAFTEQNIKLYGKELYDAVVREYNPLIELIKQKKDILRTNTEKVRLIAQEYMRRGEKEQFKLFEDLLKEQDTEATKAEDVAAAVAESKSTKDAVAAIVLRKISSSSKRLDEQAEEAAGESGYKSVVDRIVEFIKQKADDLRKFLVSTIQTFSDFDYDRLVDFVGTFRDQFSKAASDILNATTEDQSKMSRTIASLVMKAKQSAVQLKAWLRSGKFDDKISPAQYQFFDLLLSELDKDVNTFVENIAQRNESLSNLVKTASSYGTFVGLSELPAELRPLNIPDEFGDIPDFRDIPDILKDIVDKVTNTVKNTKESVKEVIDLYTLSGRIKKIYREYEDDPEQIIENVAKEIDAFLQSKPAFSKYSADELLRLIEDEEVNLINAVGSKLFKDLQAIGGDVSEFADTVLRGTLPKSASQLFNFAIDSFYDVFSQFIDYDKDEFRNKVRYITKPENLVKEYEEFLDNLANNQKAAAEKIKSVSKSIDFVGILDEIIKYEFDLDPNPIYRAYEQLKYDIGKKVAIKTIKSIGALTYAALIRDYEGVGSANQQVAVTQVKEPSTSKTGFVGFIDRRVSPFLSKIGRSGKEWFNKTLYNTSQFALAKLADFTQAAIEDRPPDVYEKFSREIMRKFGSAIKEFDYDIAYDFDSGAKKITTSARLASGAIVQLTGSIDDLGRVVVDRPGTTRLAEMFKGVFQGFLYEIGESVFYSIYTAVQNYTGLVVNTQDEINELMLLIGAQGEEQKRLYRDAFIRITTSITDITGTDYESTLKANIKNLKVFQFIPEVDKRKELASRMSLLQLSAQRVFDLDMDASIRDIPAIFSEINNSLVDIKDPSERASKALDQLEFLMSKITVAQKASAAEGNNLINIFSELMPSLQKFGMSIEDLLVLSAVSDVSLATTPGEAATILKMTLERATNLQNMQKLQELGIDTSKGPMETLKQIYDISMDPSKVNVYKQAVRIVGEARLANEVVKVIRAVGGNAERISNLLKETKGDEFSTLLDTKVNNIVGQFSKFQSAIVRFVDTLLVNTNILDIVGDMFDNLAKVINAFTDTFNNVLLFLENIDPNFVFNTLKLFLDRLLVQNIKINPMAVPTRMLNTVENFIRGSILQVFDRNIMANQTFETGRILLNHFWRKFRKSIPEITENVVTSYKAISADVKKSIEGPGKRIAKKTQDIIESYPRYQQQIFEQFNQIRDKVQRSISETETQARKTRRRVIRKSRSDTIDPGNIQALQFVDVGDYSEKRRRLPTGKPRILRLHRQDKIASFDVLRDVVPKGPPVTQTVNRFALESLGGLRSLLQSRILQPLGTLANRAVEFSQKVRLGDRAANLITQTSLIAPPLRPPRPAGISTIVASRPWQSAYTVSENFGGVLIPAMTDLMFGGFSRDNIVSVGAGIAGGFAGALTGSPMGAMIGYTIAKSFADYVDLAGITGTSKKEYSGLKDALIDITENPPEYLDKRKEFEEQVKLERLRALNERLNIQGFERRLKERGIDLDDITRPQISTEDLRNFVKLKESGKLDEFFTSKLFGLFTPSSSTDFGTNLYYVRNEKYYRALVDIITSKEFENLRKVLMDSRVNLSDVVGDLPRSVMELINDPDLVDPEVEQRLKDFLTQVNAISDAGNNAATVFENATKRFNELSEELKALYDNIPYGGLRFGPGGTEIFELDNTYNALLANPNLSSEEYDRLQREYQIKRSALTQIPESLSKALGVIKSLDLYKDMDSESLLNMLSSQLANITSESQQMFAQRMAVFAEADQFVRMYEAKINELQQYRQMDLGSAENEQIKERYAILQKEIELYKEKYQVMKGIVEQAKSEGNFVQSSLEMAKQRDKKPRIISRGTPPQFVAPRIVDVSQYTKDELLEAIDYARKRQKSLMALHPEYAKMFAKEQFLIESGGQFRKIAGISPDFIQNFLSERRQRVQMPELVDLTRLSPEELSKTLQKARALQEKAIQLVPEMRGELENKRLMILAKNNELLLELGLSQDFLRAAIEENTESNELRGHYNLPASYRPPTIWDYYDAGGTSAGEVNFVPPFGQDGVVPLSLAQQLAQKILEGGKDGKELDLSDFGDIFEPGSAPFFFPNPGSPTIIESMPDTTIKNGDFFFEGNPFEKLLDEWRKGERDAKAPERKDWLKGGKKVEEAWNEWLKAKGQEEWNKGNRSGGPFGSSGSSVSADPVVASYLALQQTFSANIDARLAELNSILNKINTGASEKNTVTKQQQPEVKLNVNVQVDGNTAKVTVENPTAPRGKTTTGTFVANTGAKRHLMQ